MFTFDEGRRSGTTYLRTHGRGNERRALPGRQGMSALFALLLLLATVSSTWAADGRNTTPGTSSPRPGGVGNLTSASQLQFYPLAQPIRLLDTREDADCLNAIAPFPAQSTTTLQVTGTCAGITIPASARAVVGNVTVVNTVEDAGSGFVTVFPSGTARPTVSQVNYDPNQIISGNFTGTLSGEGSLDLYTTQTINVIIDISGFYAPPTSIGLYYHPLPRPVRLLDTRADSDCLSATRPLPGDRTVTVGVYRRCEDTTIPVTARAIVATGTVINSSTGSPDGFVTVFTAGQQRGSVSTINFAPNQDVSNDFTVALNSQGRFNIYALRQVDFIVDVSGYFSTQRVDRNGVGLLYTPLERSVRLLDTRADSDCLNANQPIEADTAFTVGVYTTCEGVTIPRTARVAVGNSTVDNTLAGGDFGYTELYAADQARSGTSISYAPNQIVSNAFTTRLDAQGRFLVYVSTTTNVVINLNGYFSR